jgi:Na+-transporting methylmalonyl-CoA/oxaloacetate decarboxylase gamma subunit
MEVKTFGETIIFGIFAMGIVFLVLALLGFIISLFKVFFYREIRGKSEELKIEEKVTEEPQIIRIGKKKTKYTAIIAAITAYLSKKETYTISIPEESSDINKWKFKNFLTQRKSTIKEGRWKNG